MAGLVGLSLAYALPITDRLNGILTVSAETEQEMVAVERLAEYTKLQPQPVVLPPLTPTAGPAPAGVLQGMLHSDALSTACMIVMVEHHSCTVA